MKKFCLSFRIFAIMVFLPLAFVAFSFSSTSFSASLTLDKIGVLSTSNHRYSEWWYTGTSPVLQGTAPAGSEVSVSVNENITKVTSNDSGIWTYALTGLSSGDHKIVLSVDGDSYSFTLHLGQSVPASVSGGVLETSQSTVPDTGLAQVFAISAGLVSLALGVFMFSKKKDSAFLG